jgi:surface protein
MSEAKRLALQTMGYDIFFEHQGQPIAINSKEFTLEKEEKLWDRFGLKVWVDTSISDGNYVIYNLDDYRLNMGRLTYRHKGENPCLPYNLQNFSSVNLNLYGTRKLDLRHYDARILRSMHRAFYYYTKLKELYVDNWDVSGVTNMRGAFEGCVALEVLDISNWYTGNVTNFEDMFSHCEKLEHIGVGNWDVSKAKSIHGMFRGCHNLKELDLSKWVLQPECEFFQAFAQCRGLQTVKLGSGSLLLEEELRESCPWCEIIKVRRDINAFN